MNDDRMSMKRFAIALLLGMFSCLSPAMAQDAAKVDFEQDIKPIFEDHCIACHGPTEEEGFRIDEKDATMDYVEEEDSESSDLYLYLVSEHDDKMPPDDAEVPLTADEIKTVKDWIDQGADWPEGIEMQDKPLSPAAVEKIETIDQTQRVFNAVGSLHPAILHLPMGLLIAAGIFSFLSLRGNFVMSDCAYYCLWLGTLGAIAACVSGWYFAPMKLYGDPAITDLDALLDQSQEIFWHRTSAVVATVFALLLALFAASARRRDPDDGLMWKLGLMVLAGMIGFVGHKGGELTYGKNHYEDLEALTEQYFPELMGGGEAAEGENDDAETDDADANVESEIDADEQRPSEPIDDDVAMNR